MRPSRLVDAAASGALAAAAGAAGALAGAAGALAEANHAYQRRYFHIAEPVDGMVRLDGVLDVEGGATLRTALQPFMKPVKDDARNYGQRTADALVELGRQGGSGSKRDGAGPRPQLIIRASLDTLAGTKGAPAGELDVNVHPAKAEVRLADPRAAWDAIHSGLTKVLARGEWMPRSQGGPAVEPVRAAPLADATQRIADAIDRVVGY